MTDAPANWYDSGYGGMKKEEDRIAQMGIPQRFWMPAGESREFVFLEDEPFCIYEHNPKMNGNFRNWITCVKGILDGPAPCCEEIGEKTRYYVGYFTVVDCSKWTDKKGNTYQYELKFLAAKLKTLKKFKRKKEDRITGGGDGLVGCLYKGFREDDKSPSVGDEFEFLRTVDLSKLLAVANYKGKKMADLFQKANEDPTNLERLKKIFDVKIDASGQVIETLPVFNYMQLLAPKSTKDLKEMLKGNVEENDDGDKKTGFGGGKKTGPKSGADEDVPF
jgi:hypothetical protein